MLGFLTHRQLFRRYVVCEPRSDAGGTAFFVCDTRGVGTLGRSAASVVWQERVTHSILKTNLAA